MMTHCNSWYLKVWRRNERAWQRRRHEQQGAALIVTLLMLTAILMLGTSAAQIALQEEKASRNGRDRLIALQAAEAALDDAVQDIEHSQRSHLFTGDYPDDLAEGCASTRNDLYQGLCSNAAAEDAQVWQMADFPNDEGTLSVQYGYFTDRRFPSGTGMLSAKPPRYVIEFMTENADESNEKRNFSGRFFRITAIGFGVRDNTSVVVQSFYRKNSDGNEAGMPARLFGWREIANWEELRNAQTDR